MSQENTNTIEFSEFGFFIVSRNDVKFISQTGFDNDSEEILAKSMPIGAPQAESVKISKINKKYYLCYSIFDKKKDTGRGIIIDRDSTVSTVRSTQLFKGLFEIIDSEELFISTSKVKSLTLPVEEINLNNLAKPALKKIDGLFYAILAKLPIFVVGNQQEIKNNYYYFSYILPEWVTKSLTYVTQTSSLRENVIMLGFPISKEIMQNIEENLNTLTTVAHLEKQTIYAPFSSPICKKLADSYYSDDLVQFEKILSELFTIAKTSKSTNVEDLAQEKSLIYGEAQLVLAIKGIIEGKPLDKEIFKINEINGGLF